MAKGIVDSYRRQAEMSEAVGVTFRLWALEGPAGVMTSLRAELNDGGPTNLERRSGVHELRLRVNECGGVTLMLPEDD